MREVETPDLRRQVSLLEREVADLRRINMQPPIFLRDLKDINVQHSLECKADAPEEEEKIALIYNRDTGEWEASSLDEEVEKVFTDEEYVSPETEFGLEPSPGSYYSSYTTGYAEYDELRFSSSTHTHGSPSLSDTVTEQTDFSLSSDPGFGTTAARSDHIHGTPLPRHPQVGFPYVDFGNDGTILLGQRDVAGDSPAFLGTEDVGTYQRAFLTSPHAIGGGRATIDLHGHDNATAVIKLYNDRDINGNYGSGDGSESSPLMVQLGGNLTFQAIDDTPPVTPSGEARIYYDASLGRLRLSENGGAYRDIGGGSATLGNSAVSEKAFSNAPATAGAEGSASRSDHSHGTPWPKHPQSGFPYVDFGTSQGLLALGRISSEFGPALIGTEDQASSMRTFFTSPMRNSTSGRATMALLGRDDGTAILDLYNDLDVNNAIGDPGTNASAKPFGVDLKGDFTFHTIANTPPLAPSGQAKLHYASGKLKLSENGGAYVDIYAPLSASTSVISERSYSQNTTVGTLVAYSRGDHSHGTPLPRHPQTGFPYVDFGVTPGLLALGRISTEAEPALVGTADHTTEMRIFVTSPVRDTTAGRGVIDIFGATGGAARVRFYNDRDIVGSLGVTGNPSNPLTLELEGNLTFMSIADTPAPSAGGTARIYYSSGKLKVSENGGLYVDLVTGATPANTVVSETTYGQSTAVGVNATYSRSDHSHGSPSLGSTVVTGTAFSQTSTAGTGTTPSRVDHSHGTPTPRHPQTGFPYVDFGTSSGLLALGRKSGEFGPSLIGTSEITDGQPVPTTTAERTFFTSPMWSSSSGRATMALIGKTDGTAILDLYNDLDVNNAIGDTPDSSKPFGVELKGDFTFFTIANTPPVAPAGQAKLYYASGKLKLSENGGAYRDIGGEVGFGSPGTFLVTSSTGTARRWTGSSELVIDSSGSVGIGISSPSAKLHVNGEIKVQTGNALRFPHASELDTNDGKLGAALFASGLNIVGIKTDATFRKVSIWGEITQIQNDGTNSWIGINTFSGSVTVNGVSNLNGGVSLKTSLPSARGALIGVENLTTQERVYITSPSGASTWGWAVLDMHGVNDGTARARFYNDLDVNNATGDPGTGASSRPFRLELQGALEIQTIADTPAVAPGGTARLYYASGKLKVSENGGSYVDVYSPLTPSTSVVTGTSFGLAGAIGVSTTYSRGDHSHGTPSLGSTVAAQTAFSLTSTGGSSTVASRADHSHGTPGPRHPQTGFPNIDFGSSGLLQLYRTSGDYSAALIGTEDLTASPAHERLFVTSPTKASGGGRAVIDLLGFSDGSAEVKLYNDVTTDNQYGNAGNGISKPFKFTVQGTVNNRGAGANQFQWGHSSAAYVNTLGHETNSGHGFIAFYAEAGTNADTYKTLGQVGRIIEAHTGGALTIGRAANANADNQLPTDDIMITGSGLVGIGTNSPPYRLTVSNGGASGLEFGPAYTSGATLIQAYNRTASVYDKIDFYASAYQFFVGMVGIGVNPGYALDVNGDIRMQNGNRSIHFNNTLVQTSITQMAGSTAALRTDANVGIGINPAERLQLNFGNILIGFTTTTDEYVIFGKTASVGGNAGLLIRRSSPGGGLTYFGTGLWASYQSTWLSGPTEINGHGRPIIQMLSFGNGAADVWMYNDHKTNGTYGGGGGGSSSTILSLRVEGPIFTSGVQLTSDPALKTDIRKAPGGALDKLRKFEPEQWIWKNGGGSQIGPGRADKLAKIDSTLVTYNREGKPDGWKLSEMTALLIGGIQEHDSEIEKLKKENEALKNRVSVLEAAK